MKKVLILANNDMGLYKFRKELLETLIQKRYDVVISLPEGEYIPKLKEIGCTYIPSVMERRGKNPFKDLKLLFFYRQLIKKEKPDIVLTYTIKPNIYGGLACRWQKVPYMVNITGLGMALENPGMLQRLTIILYKAALKKTSVTFFQNEKNQQFFLEHKINCGNSILLPGSGVNLKEHLFETYPEDGTIRILFVGRVMEAKGIRELLEAAGKIKKEKNGVVFQIVGPYEENYAEIIKKNEKNGIIQYFGKQDDVHAFIKDAHAVIMPSHFEGMSNVLLEAASAGRPVLASAIPGCTETFDEGISGFSFEVKNVQDMKKTIEKFLALSYEEKKAMGRKGREKMEHEFDRNIIIDKYLEQIRVILN